MDEQALTEALLEGHLRGTALDALIQEPPGPDHPLLNLPSGIASNVIITPHLGAQTDGSTNQMGWMALNDCLAVLRGEAPAYIGHLRETGRIAVSQTYPIVQKRKTDILLYWRFHQEIIDHGLFPEWMKLFWQGWTFRLKGSI